MKYEISVVLLNIIFMEYHCKYNFWHLHVNLQCVIFFNPLRQYYFTKSCHFQHKEGKVKGFTFKFTQFPNNA